MLNGGLRHRQQVLPPPPARDTLRYSCSDEKYTSSSYYDWIVPFIPPVFRVNRDTRAKAYSNMRNNFSVDALRNMIHLLWSCKLSCLKILTSGFLWIRLLSWIHENATEFANAYVIFSGLALIVYNCNSAIVETENGQKPLSAYSIFNPNVERVLGSLTADQFEVRGAYSNTPYRLLYAFRTRSVIDCQSWRMMVLTKMIWCYLKNTKTRK